MKVSIVLFIISDKNKMIQMILVNIHDSQKEMYLSLLHPFKDSLKFIHEKDIPFPKDLIGDDGLKQKGCHVAVAAVKLHLGIWK